MNTKWFILLISLLASSSMAAQPPLSRRNFSPAVLNNIANYLRARTLPKMNFPTLKIDKSQTSCMAIIMGYFYLLLQYYEASTG